MMCVEQNTAYNLRFNPMYYSSYSSSYWDCNGIQFKRCIHCKRSQRFLLLPKKASLMVRSRDGSAVDHKKPRLPQASSIHLSHHDLHIPFINHSNIPRIQQKSWWSASVVDLGRVFIPTFRACEIYTRSIYCQIFSKTSGQIKKFCLRVFTQFNRIRVFFHTDFISTRFWDRYDHLRGYIDNALYRRAQEKISISFNSGNSSFYNLGNYDCRISDKKNLSLPQTLGRSIWNRIPSHSIFLCFWKRWILGDRFRTKLSKTFSPSRGAHGFYFFSNRRRAGIHRNHSNRYSIFNFYLEGFYNCLPSQRSFWNSFGNRTDSINRLTGFYKLRSGFGPSSYKRTDPAFYKYGRIFDADNDAFSRCFTKYFKAS